MVPVVPLFST